VAQLVFSSSCTVYGQADQLPVTEATPWKPAESPYGRSKQICEQLIEDVVAAGRRAAAEGRAGPTPLQAVTLRYFNPIGAHPSGLIGELPRGTPDNLVPYITQTAAGIRDQLTVHGDDYGTPDGSCIRDYIHVMDLAEAHVKALDWLAARPGPGAMNEILNVGTGRGVSVLEAVRAFEAASGRKLNYRIGPRRPGDIEKIWADTSKCQRVLGFVTRRGVEEAMRDAWNWQVRLARIKARGAAAPRSRP
jgi:UDP-glucose 4-epimerase